MKIASNKISVYSFPNIGSASTSRNINKLKNDKNADKNLGVDSDVTAAEENLKIESASDLFSAKTYSQNQNIGSKKINLPGQIIDKRG